MVGISCFSAVVALADDKGEDDDDFDDLGAEGKLVFDFAFEPIVGATKAETVVETSVAQRRWYDFIVFDGFCQVLYNVFVRISEKDANGFAE
jgi:hypothetical protein